MGLLFGFHHICHRIPNQIHKPGRKQPKKPTTVLNRTQKQNQRHHHTKIEPETRVAEGDLGERSNTVNGATLVEGGGLRVFLTHGLNMVHCKRKRKEFY